MAYAIHSDVSAYMSIPAFSANTTPTITVVNAGIVLAQSRLDIYTAGDTISVAGKKLAVCMMVKRMINSGRVYLVNNEDPTMSSEDLMFPAVRALIDEEREEAGDVGIVVSNHPDTQTSDNPDNFV